VTGMDYLDMFMNEKLAINLFQATDEELQRLDEIIPIKWASGQSFQNLKTYTEYVHNAYKSGYCIRYYVGSKPGKTVVTAREFVDAVGREVSVTEDEICDLLR